MVDTLIKAKKRMRITEMPSGMYSRSEGNIVAGFYWEYTIPNGMVFSEEPQAKSENIPIVDIDTKKIIGYAVTGWYACYGKLYNSKDKIPFEYYQGEIPEPYSNALYRAKTQKRQLEEGWYGA